MNKYPNKTKRIGFWKVYEQANIKDFRKVWDTALEINHLHFDIAILMRDNPFM